MVFGAGVQAGRPERAVPSSGTAVVVARKCRPAAKPRSLPAPSRWKAEIRRPGRSAAATLCVAVLDAGICERRTRLAGPFFRPAGGAVARAGVRRPSRGRRLSRPRDGGRTAVPGPAGSGVRPAGGCRRSERVAIHPLRGRMGRLCVQAKPLKLARRGQGEDGGGTPPKRRAGRPARGPRRTDRIQCGPRRSRALSGPPWSASGGWGSGRAAPPRGAGGFKGGELAQPPFAYHDTNVVGALLPAAARDHEHPHRGGRRHPVHRGLHVPVNR